jgi:hypothetical protein
MLEVRKKFHIEVATEIEILAEIEIEIDGETAEVGDV